MKRAIVLLVTLTLVVAACGDDATGDATTTAAAPEGLVDDLTQQIRGRSAPGSATPLDDEQAACFAAGLIDSFGAEVMVDALQMEFGEFMAQATADQRTTVVDTMLDCVDFSTMMVAEFEGVISDESARCVGDAFVGSTAFRQALANSFGASASDPFEDPAVVEELLPVMLTCMSAEELINLGNRDG